MEEAKKTKSPRDYISPSDLTFLWSECKKCFWLKYNKGITRPGFMPLVGPMAAYQEKLYHLAPSSDIASNLAPGVVRNWGETVESKPFVINGVETKWRIKGKYDFLLTFEDGRTGLIDCKVTTSEIDGSKISLYWPQLEAYAYALESPLSGQAHVVSETGLLIWRVEDATTDNSSSHLFKSEKGYLSAGRRPEMFSHFISEVVSVLDGEIPDSSEKCSMCKFVDKRNAVEAA